jgi:hypothetical protein
MRRGDAPWLVLALLTAAVTSAFDLPSDEVVVPLVFLLPLTFVLGFGRPMQAWRWALIAGLGVPLGRMIAMTFDLPVKDPSPVLETCVVFIPAFAGTYAGVAARALLEALAGRDSGVRG